MATPNPSETLPQYWRRVLRPLFWWLLLVLVMFGIRTHQRLMEKTRLNFTVTLGGGQMSFFNPASATFDGKAIASGDNIPLGHHQFTITYPKGETFSTNLFIWYGAYNFGAIDLKRSMSVLSVSANPPAPVLSIRGPEFDVTLTNSSGMTSSVPTDRYVIMSRYAHWSRSDDVTVSPGMSATWRIAPRLGSAQITCNQADATGQFMDADGRIIEAVTFPYAIVELPEGTYKVTAQHHRDELAQTVTVTANTTNQVALDFLYGSAVLETEPSGAAVKSVTGQYLGVTPLKLNELKSGNSTFVLQRDGYVEITADLTITADQLTTFQTNLISLNYVGSMKDARGALDQQDYIKALKALSEALNAKPGDSTALELQRQANISSHLTQAKAKSRVSDYISAVTELNAVLELSPGQTEASRLLAEYQPQVPAQLARIRQERMKIPNEALGKALLGNTFENAGRLFDAHTLKISLPIAKVKAALVAAFGNESPTFQVRNSDTYWTNSFVLVCEQTPSGGLRTCVIAGAQVGENETHIAYEVIEYQSKRSVSFDGHLMITTSYVALHPSKVTALTDAMTAQIEDGLQLVKTRIQQAVGAEVMP